MLQEVSSRNQQDKRSGTIDEVAVVLVAVYH